MKKLYRKNVIIDDNFLSQNLQDNNIFFFFLLKEVI